MKGPIVSVQVGVEAENFLLHKGLLTDKCPAFFGAAFKGGFSEAESSSIKLPEDDATAFRLFVDWLYCGTIPAVPFRREWMGQSVKTMKSSGQLDAERPYHQLYYMAEKWLIYPLANHAIDFIRNFHNGTETTVHPKLVIMAYHNTRETSPLREYLLQSAAFAISLYSNDPDKKKKQNEFFQAMNSGSSAGESDVLYDLLKHYAHTGSIKTTHNPHIGDSQKYHIVPPKN